MDRNRIGFLGEQKTHQKLPESRWVSAEELNGGSHHDIEWEGIKIEVKTSISPYTSRNGDPLFNFSLSGFNDCDVYVFVGIYKAGVYYWVESKKKVKSGYYGKLSRELGNKDLGKAIKEAVT